jgi:hypothetical protein
MRQLEEALTISHKEHLCEMGMGAIKSALGSVLSMPKAYIKRKVVDSWKLVKSQIEGTEKETKLLEFYSFIFNKNYQSLSQLDYIFSSLEEGLNVQSLTNFYSQHSALVASAGFALLEVFANIMGYSSIVLACVYITITLAMFLFENEDEVVEFLKDLKNRVGKYLKFTAAAAAVAKGGTIPRPMGHGATAAKVIIGTRRVPRFDDVVRKVPRVD